MSIKFKFVNAPYGFLSNFSPHPVIYEGKQYKTSEALYQSLKFLDTSKREIVRACITAKDAALAGRTLDGIRPDWDEVKLDTMRTVIRLKADQHPFIKTALLKSGDEIIIEDSNKDKFWGQTPTGEGLNWLGIIWMELRSKLSQDICYDKNEELNRLESNKGLQNEA